MIHPSILLFLVELFFIVLNKIFEDRKDLSVIDSSEFLKLSDVDICVYDKTGTLTNAEPLLGGVICGGRFF